MFGEGKQLITGVTFVSCLPFDIREDMPHIHPSHYELEGAPRDGFNILHIANGIDRVYAGDGKHIERIVLALDIANNLKQMVVNSQMAISENASPGIFILDGIHHQTDIERNFSAQVKSALFYQRNWFRNLVNEGDDIWGKFRQHRMISDVHRHACRALALQREWNVDVNTEIGPSFCPACASVLPNPDVTVCSTCHTIINRVEHEKRFGAKLGAGVASAGVAGVKA